MEVLGFFSAILVAIIAIVGQVVAYKVQRKDKLSDTAAEDNKKIFATLSTIDSKIQNIEDSIQNVKDELKKESAIQSRIRILRFADEILQGIGHSKEHFDQILEDITQYEHYCAENPNFLNNVTITSTEIIKDNFKKCFESNGFL